MEEKTSLEIDIVSLAKKIAGDWKTLLKFVAVFAVVGVIVALSTPKTYKSEVILAPEMSSGGLGLSSNLADMASNFGIDLGSKTSMDAIYPELYPDIFSSTDFVLKLFNVPVCLKDDNTPRTYSEHLLKDTKVPFWLYPRVWIGEMLAKKPEAGDGKKYSSDKYKLSKLQNEMCLNIANSITCVIDKKTSEITINVTDQDPLVAAIMADTLQSRLQSYITEYRTKKARNDYNYYLRMMKESKARYVKAQHLYASYSDANEDLLLESFKSKRDELENEMQLQYNVYNQMAAELKQAEAKVQERTPAFTIIKNAYMPMKASSSPRAVTVLIFVILGCIMDSLWVLFGRDLYQRRKTSKKTI